MRKTIMVNGTSLSPGRAQRGVANVPKPHVSTEALRRMDHPEWLENFAKLMQLETGVEMTPLRMGIINRSLMAAEYIRLLRHDITRLEKANELLTTQIREHQRIDEEFSR
jgi:hypothetical protein